MRRSLTAAAPAPPHPHLPLPPAPQALAVNEFTGPSWAFPYNASLGDASPTMGQVILEFRGFGTE